MPTSKQRITITATGDIEQILAVEARLQPNLGPSALVADLIRRGHGGHMVDDRAELVAALAGGIEYPADYLDEQRSEWPD